MKMHIVFRMALVLDWIIAAGWLWGILVCRRNLPRVPDLAKNPSIAPSGSLPSLTVIVPARNEGDAIAATLGSLLASEGVRLDVIAVDDRSLDETGAIMDGLAAQQAGDPAARVPLTVLHVTELPAGWLGKTHAMQLGAQAAQGEWLLFTDGDVVFHPDALRRALGYAVESHGDHMVLFPTVVLRSPGERMMVALLHVLSLLAMRPWNVPNPLRKRDYIGVGAFNMIRRSVYESLGGWASLRFEVIEDVGLGRRVKAAGYAQRAAFGLDLVSVRWARGAFGVVNNLTKNLFAFFRFQPLWLLGGACAVGLFTLMPLALCFAGRAAWWPMGVVLAALVLAYRRAGTYHHFSGAQVVLYPAASCLLIYAMLRSMLLALWRGGIDWRGTFYSLAALRAMREKTS